MVGAVIVTHGSLADALVEVAESIAGKIGGVKTVQVKRSDVTGNVREALQAAIKEVDSGMGVVIMTDMFGGTPTNIALSLFEAGRIEVITGVNLPLVLKFITHRVDKKLEDLARILKDAGHKSIVLAGDMLREKK